MDSSFANCYRDLILNGEFPLIIHEPLNWECLTWNLVDWVNIFRDKLLRFRCGRRQCQKVGTAINILTKDLEFMSFFVEIFSFRCGKDNAAPSPQHLKTSYNSVVTRKVRRMNGDILITNTW